MVKAVRDYNKIKEEADPEEPQDGEEELASDSPLLEMNIEEEIEAVRREMEELKQQMDDIESVPPPEGMIRLPCAAHKVSLALFSVDFNLIQLNLEFRLTWWWGPQ